VNIHLNNQDEARLNLALNRLAEGTGKTLREVLPAQMRLFATDLAYVTRPKGKGSNDNADHKKSIADRIRSVYPSVGWVVNQLKTVNEPLAGRFASMMSTRGTSAKAQQILDTNLPRLRIKIGPWDGGELHRAEQFKKRVTHRLLVPTQSKVESYIKATQQKSGFAKGGFATAARQLGGVRGIPGFATRQKAPGTGTVTGDGKTLTVTMTNEVRHLQEALSKADISVASNVRESKATKLLRDIQERRIKEAMKSL